MRAGRKAGLDRAARLLGPQHQRAVGEAEVRERGPAFGRELHQGPGCGGRFFHAARCALPLRMKPEARRPSHPLTPRAIGDRDAYHRAVASSPMVCSGSVQLLSRRVPFSPKETSGALARVAGVRRHPTL